MHLRHALRLSFAVVLAALVWCAPAGANAIPESLLWDADDPGADPANVWQAGSGSHAWAVDGGRLRGHGQRPLRDHACVSLRWACGRRQRHPLQVVGARGDNASFETWFRPTSYSGGQQVVFESVGRRGGLSIKLDDSMLLFRVQDYGNVVVSLMFDLSSDPFLVDPTEFVQVVGSIDLDDTAQLFVNGNLVASVSAAGLSDFAGPGHAGVGNVNDHVGGSAGPGEGTSSATARSTARLRYCATTRIRS